MLMHSKPDISSPEDIKTLIDSFYTKVRCDSILGFIFNDVAQVDWPHHLPRMYAFWEFLILDSDTYQGNPMEPHKRLNEKIQLKKEFFDRWIELFHHSVDENFSGNKAEETKSKARLIALTWIPKFDGIK